MSICRVFNDMLSVVMLNVVMPRVVAPPETINLPSIHKIRILSQLISDLILKYPYQTGCINL
jgi:hypothetical protein